MDPVLRWLRSKLFDQNYSRNERLVVVKLIEEYKMKFPEGMNNYIAMITGRARSGYELIQAEDDEQAVKVAEQMREIGDHLHRVGRVDWVATYTHSGQRIKP